MDISEGSSVGQVIDRYQTRLNTKGDKHVSRVAVRDAMFVRNLFEEPVSEEALQDIDEVLNESSSADSITIAVFARVRPFVPNDGHDMDALPESAVKCDAAKNALTVFDRGTETSFQFDRVFGQSVSQEAMFAEVSEFVQSALDGHNVCLFSYGQTGSGKVRSLRSIFVNSFNSGFCFLIPDLHDARLGH